MASGRRDDCVRTIVLLYAVIMSAGGHTQAPVVKPVSQLSITFTTSMLRLIDGQVCLSDVGKTVNFRFLYINRISVDR